MSVLKGDFNHCKSCSGVETAIGTLTKLKENILFLQWYLSQTTTAVVIIILVFST